MKKKLRQFFALARKNSDGFTLVELIVVIAILGILAGVGTVGYSGYIKKANAAADEVLLSSLNTAFAAACIENGVNPTEVTANDINLTDKKVDEADIVLTHAKADDIEEAFWNYYEGGEFKVVTKLNYNSAKGVFENPAMVSVDYHGIRLNLSEKDIENLKNSNFGDMGAEKLLTETANTVQWAIDNDIEGGANFAKAFASYLGLEEGDDLDAAILELAGGDELRAPQIGANAFVLYAAENSASVTKDSISNWLGGTVADIQENESGKTLAEASAIYGLYLSYKGPDSADFDSGNVVGTLGAALNDDEFAAWLDSDKGDQELGAYLSAMSVISSAAQDKEAASAILKNGLNDAELVDVMKGLLGK